MKKIIRTWIKRFFGLYDLDDLQVGAHCGLCGNWMEKEIVPRIWPWSVCETCIKEAEYGTKI